MRGTLSIICLLAWGLATPLAAAPQEQVAKAETTRPGDKVRCRSQKVTGSLAQTKRVCMTEREWAIERENVQNFQSLICSNRTACGAGN
jgi:hypothetical protein